MSTDVLFPNSSQPKGPADVHNYLKRFLFDNFRFRSTFDVYAFSGLLAEANANNTSWVRMLVYSLYSNVDQL